MLKILVLIIFGLAFGYYSYSIFKESYGARPNVACTKEAKLCPDGSAVGRTGPACTFAKCPSN